MPTVLALPRLDQDRPTARHGDSSTPPIDPATLDCSACDGELDWHQPDARRPGRLLATCSDCGGWYLLDEVAGEVSVRVLVAPMAFETRPSPH